MNTLIIPCAGRSSRFPNMKPKWMLTHPDGKLMIEKSIAKFPLQIFDRIIITVVQEHCKIYEADVILHQVFQNNKKVEICILDNFTKSASETIYLTIQKMHVSGSFVVKDSDNAVACSLDRDFGNAIVGYDLQEHPNISNIPSKSFLITNEQHIISDIIEKRVVSNIICLGVYAFQNADLFVKNYLELIEKGIKGEMFISHVISYMLSQRNIIFNTIMADDYDDWGTLEEWRKVQEICKTYFVDIDGVICRNHGKYGKVNWYNSTEILEENLNTIIELQKKGAQIVITTSRPEEFREALEKTLHQRGLYPHSIIMGLNHSARVLVNDFAPTNPFPSARAITLPRNSNLKEYLN